MSILSDWVNMPFLLLVSVHGVNNRFKNLLASSVTGCRSWLSSDNFDWQPGREFGHLCLHLAHAPC